MVITHKLTAGRIKRSLTRGKDKLTAAYSLTVRSDSCWRVFGADLYALHSYFPQNVMTTKVAMDE